jgi:hypothetical protein
MSMNKDKMKAKCEAWIKEGMGACRAPVTYDELLGLIIELEQAKSDCRKYKLTGLAVAVQLGEK